MTSPSTSQRVLELADRLLASSHAEEDRHELDGLLANLDPEARALAARVVQMSDERRRFKRGLLQTAKVAEVGLAFAELIHELRQPLASISGFAQLLDADSTAQEVSKNVEEIRHQCGRMEAMIERMRRFVRADEEGRPGPRTVNVETALRKALALLPKMPPGVQLDARIPAGLGLAVGEELPLTQVLLNLVANARDAQEQRGPGTVSVRAEATAGGIIVTVADEGAGVPAEFQRRLFEPFATTKGEAGTGLGLYICRELVSGWGGEVTHLSPAPRPFVTAFRVTLRAAEVLAGPATPAELQGVRAELERELSKVVPHRRALVVEDEPGVRRVLRVLLSAEPSVQVEEAPDGVQALQALATRHAEVLVADRGLPGMTGIELIRRARAEGRAAEAVVVTGFPSPETVLEAIEVGACGFFVKPIDDAEALRACLRGALDRDADRQRVAGLGPVLRPWAVRALAAARLAAAPEPVLEALTLLSHRQEGPAKVGVVAERALVAPLALEGHRAEGPWEVDRALVSLDDVEAIVLGEGLNLDEAFDAARRILATPAAPALLWALPTGSFEETLALLGNPTTGIIRRPLDYPALARTVTRAVETRRRERRAQALRVVLAGMGL